MEGKSKYSVPNLERALRVIELLSGRREGLIVSQIAKELDVPRNSVFRICITLKDSGYIEYYQGSQRYVLTRKLFTVGYRALGEVNIVQLAREPMLELRDAVKETVLLGTLLENEGAVLEEIPGSHHFNFRVEKGAKFHLHCSAPGKVLLAHLSLAQQASVVDQLEMPRFNEHTITSRSVLLETLKQVRETGVGFDFSEQIDGCHCVAAPVLDAYGYPVAAIWTTGPASRVGNLKNVAELVKATAKKISEQLGAE